jgi:6-phosphofructokinase 2
VHFPGGYLPDRIVLGPAVSDAVRFGIAAGSSAVMSPGSKLCCKDDAERLYDEMGS